MNLIIDIGNTRAKLAVYQDNKILKTLICRKEELYTNQKKILKQFPNIKNGILANVSGSTNNFEKALSGIPKKKLYLSPSTPVPFINLYRSQKTLGLDRIALAAAAVSTYPQQNILVIDAGTCVTYDIITADKTYLGGAISPGLNMRFRALNNFTANLPLLRADNKKKTFDLGQNTVDSLQLGVNQGLSYEIDGFINQFQQSYENLTVILTGGDCEILCKSIKNSIFAVKNFLLTGLNCILEYNKT